MTRTHAILLTVFLGVVVFLPVTATGALYEQLVTSPAAVSMGSAVTAYPEL